MLTGTGLGALTAAALISKQDPATVGVSDEVLFAVSTIGGTILGAAVQFALEDDLWPRLEAGPQVGLDAEVRLGLGVRARF